MVGEEGVVTKIDWLYARLYAPSRALVYRESVSTIACAREPIDCLNQVVRAVHNSGKIVIAPHLCEE